MKKDIQVILLDIDGTLFTSEHKMSTKTKETLMKAQAQGIRLILASGRPTSGLMPIAHELEMDKHHGLLVSYNGAKVVDCETQEELFAQNLRVEEVKAVLEHMKKFDVNPMIDKGKYMYVNDVYGHMVEYESRGGNFLLCEQEDLASFVDFEVAKILTAGIPEYLQEHYQAMMEPFKDELSCMFTAPVYFEFTSKGIDKAKALHEVLTPLHYSQQQILAFGDGQNDRTMLEFAGTGVAMGNAVDEVKAIADDITLSNDEDGIVVAIEKYVDLR